MKNKNKQLYISAVTAILAFIGALIGTYISGYMQDALWNKDIRYHEKQILLIERIRLIERASKIINLAPQYTAIQSFAELQANIAKLNSECENKNKDKGTCCFSQENIIEVTKFTNLRADLNAEFASVLQLAALHFGPRTKQAVIDYSVVQPWWNADLKYSRELLSAMQSEISD